VKQTYRSKTAFVLGWVWVAFALFNAYDLTARYNGKPSLVAAAVLGVITAAVYVIALRPATTMTEDGLTARNPLRSTFLPWAAVKGTRVSHSVIVDYSGDDGKGEVLRLWTPMATARERARARRRGAPKPQRAGRFRTEPTLTKSEQVAAELLAGKTHADWVGEQIAERAEAARRRDRPAGPVRTVWAIDSLVAVALAVVLIVVAVILE
jgi:hypothetical protein